MSKANDGSDSSSRDGRTSEIDKHERNSQPTRIRIKAGDLEVKASSNDDDAQTLSRIASQEMDALMRKRIHAEYQVLEEEDLYGIFLGNE